MAIDLNKVLESAKAQYKKATKANKDLLEKLFGKETFKGSIIDRIKTFEDACRETGEDPKDKKFKIGTPDEIAFKRIKVICKALREGAILDFKNPNQYKWYPWFRYDGTAGFRFDVAYYGDVDAVSAGGSRLCVDTKEKAEYLGKQFISEYDKLLN